MSTETKKISIAVLIAIIATAALIYLTPLKWITVIEPTIKDIDSQEFYDMYVQNPDEYIFIDVRPEDPFNRVHAQGSINMPVHTLYDERRFLPKKGKTIVLICSGGRASGVAYSYLEHFGFRNILRIEGGIEDWMAAGLPIEGSEVQALKIDTQKKFALQKTIACV